MVRTLLFCMLALLTGRDAVSAVRETTLLDKGWSFIRKEVPHGESVSLNDSDWEKVKVPHDWAITGQFDMNIDMQWVQVIEDGEKRAQLRTGRTGALPCFGVGWYRKTLPVSASDQGKRIFVEFDGAMSQAKIYLNGEYIGEWPYGYSSFSFELTRHIRFGQDNLLAVRLENESESSRWYPGAGLYRNVRLVKTAPTRIAQWGIFITTPVISAKTAEVSVKTEIDRAADATGEIRLVTDIFNDQ